MDLTLLRRALVRALLALVFVTLGALSLVLAARLAEPNDPRPAHFRPRPPPVLLDRPLHIAGSGSNVPLVRFLSERFHQENPDVPVVVHDSIGSGGGVQAVLEGSIHIGLVSRPLTALEEALGLRAWPHVRVAVVFAAHPAVPDDHLSEQDIVHLTLGRDVRWSDGTRVVLLQRERGDSSRRALLAFSAPIRRATKQAQGRTHWRLLLHDADMVEALSSTPGAVGLLDLGVLRLSPLRLRWIRLGDLDPEALTYPIQKELAFVTRQSRSAEVTRFLSWATREANLQSVRAFGYLPPRRDSSRQRGR